MTQHIHHLLTRLTAIALAAGAMAFTGCSQREPDQAKAKTDQAVSDVKQAGSEMKADIKESTSGMRSDASAALDKAKVSVADATITSSVKAELAKDSVLKARDINVDTESGRVSLRGTAPTLEAKERAKTLAAGVTGVMSVNNELKVQSNS